jgi:hypothetical protein
MGFILVLIGRDALAADADVDVARRLAAWSAWGNGGFGEAQRL